MYFDRYGMTDVAGNQLTYYCAAGSCLGNYSFTHRLRGEHLRPAGDGG